MPTVVQVIDTITEWAQAEICSKIRLKMPPEDDTESNAADYNYTQIEPTSFSLFIPTKDKLPPSVLSPIPSLCVRVIGGADDLTDNSGTINIEFALSTWSTGTHGKDIVIPDKTNPLHFTEISAEEAKGYFEKNSDGWRDCWNWIDTALRVIESNGSIMGIQIDRGTPITYGPFTEQD